MVESRKSVLDPPRAAGRWARRRPYGCPTWEAGEHLRLLMLIFLLFVLSESPVQSCCLDDSRPTSDCSFAPHSQSRAHVACTLKDYRTHTDGCYRYHEHWTNNNDEIPGKVEDLEFNYYYTQCDRSLSEDPDQMSDRCPANCDANNGMSYIAINITFKLDYTSASKLSALEIKLHGNSGGLTHQATTWCVLYEYGKGNVTYDDAVNNIFFYDGFIGLVPDYTYEVGVRTLPTAKVDQSTWEKYKLRNTRRCWSPFASWHSTPFAVNFTLILNSEGYYKDSIDEYYIAVSSSDNTSSIREEEIVQNKGNKTDLCFGCLKPGTYTVEIRARGNCESCLPFVKNHTVWAGGKPPISACPGNTTLYTEVGGNVSVTWSNPSAVSPCPKLAPINTSQTHHSGDVFQEGTSTEVRYEFWQYNQDNKSTCSFYVHIISDTDPPVVTCSNVTLRPESPNTFNGLIDGESYTYSDTNTDPSGITYITKGISGDLFPPGHTPITLVAVDEFGNNATCLFYVENILTELPVNCPILDRSVIPDPGKKTYTFLPNLGEPNITKIIPGYRYHGDAVSLDITIGGSVVGSSVSIGTHEVVAVMRDDVLAKTCKGFYNVMEVHRQPTSVVAIVGAVIGIALVILLGLITINSCTRKPGKSRFETCKQKLKQLTGKTIESQHSSDAKPEEGYSYPDRGDGIDLRILDDATSVFSSIHNINIINHSKVKTWIDTNPDSGIERSKELDGEHLIDRGEEYHDQRHMSQVHECVVHSDSCEKQPESGNSDSGLGISCSQEHLHHHSNSEDEERGARNEGTKQPLLDHRHMSLAESNTL